VQTTVVVDDGGTITVVLRGGEDELKLKHPLSNNGMAMANNTIFTV
jgi:hypothetical protein